jgi:transcriptional regulator with XRE-family HTH domain
MANMSEAPRAGTEFGRYLQARRTKVNPADVGLNPGPGPRRTPGLRREEVAVLSGISADYYTRLERGKETRPSPAVIDAVARALLLDEVERDHLHGLAGPAARHLAERVAIPRRTVSPGLLLMLETLRPLPAQVISRSYDLLAANPGGLHLFAGLASWAAPERNLARYTCLHPLARELFADWDYELRATVSGLRTLLGANPGAPDLTDLVSELMTKSSDFARLWQKNEVLGYSDSYRVFRHPRVGALSLGCQAVRPVGGLGQYLVTYFADPGTPDHDTLVLLAATISSLKDRNLCHRASPAGWPKCPLSPRVVAAK